MVERRPHFALRVGLLGVVVLSPVWVVVGMSSHALTVPMAQALFLWFLLLAALAIAVGPWVLYSSPWLSLGDSGPPPGPSDDDDGGPERQDPLPPPGPTPGDLPLPHADQAGWRVRDHGSGSRQVKLGRRPARADGRRARPRPR